MRGVKDSVIVSHVRGLPAELSGKTKKCDEYYMRLKIPAVVLLKA